MIATSGGRQELECIYIIYIKTIALTFTQSCEKIGHEHVDVYGDLFFSTEGGT